MKRFIVMRLVFVVSVMLLISAGAVASPIIPGLYVFNNDFTVDLYSASTGTFVKTAVPAVAGNDSGAFQEKHLAVGTDGTVYASAGFGAGVSAVRRLTRYSGINGAFESVVVSGGVGRVAVGPNGNVYVRVGSTVQEYSSSPGDAFVRTVVASLDPSAGPVFGFAVGLDGDVYTAVEDSAGGNLIGRLIRYDGATGQQKPDLGSKDYDTVAVGPSGLVYASTFGLTNGGLIDVLDPVTNQLVRTVTPQLTDPVQSPSAYRDIAIGLDGDIFLLLTDFNGSIFVDHVVRIDSVTGQQIGSQIVSGSIGAIAVLVPEPSSLVGLIVGGLVMMRKPRL